MAAPLSKQWREDEVPQEITALKSHIEQLPLHVRDKLRPLCDRLGHYTRLQSRLVRVAQDAVDQLQLDVKYLMFDLEATRRERDEFRKRLSTSDLDIEDDED